MLRVVFAIVAAAGCDIAFQIDEIEVATAPCGPYSTVTPVVIEGVVEPKGFSAVGDLGMVTGNDAGNVRPFALRFDGTRWAPDPTLQMGLDALDGANLAPFDRTPVGDDYIGELQPALVGWNGQPRRMSRYFFDGAKWVFDVNQSPLLDSDYDFEAGNVISVMQTTAVDDIVRHTVVIKRAIVTGVTNQIVVYANVPPTFDLIAKPDRTLKLNTAGVMTGQAVYAGNLTILVYAAVDSSAQSDLFASPRSPVNDFDKGAYVKGVNTADDEVEPWIDETCSKLYFRRTPAGRPNDTGQIFLAE